jgi:hypothetical protein
MAERIDQDMLYEMAREYGLEAEKPAREEWNFLQNIIDYWRDPVEEGRQFIKTIIEDYFGGETRPFSATRAAGELQERGRRLEEVAPERGSFYELEETRY